MNSIAWEPAVAAAAALALAGAVAWWLLTDLPAPRAPVPGYRGEAFQPLSAEMPQIAGFDTFYVNDDNPFVSFREREAERKRLQQPAAVVVKARPPPVIKTIEPPVLRLPPKTGGGGDAPRVIGFNRRPDGTASVLVALPGEAAQRLMAPGEQAGRWTFIEVQDGNIAIFRDQTGRVYRLVIGGR